jgi:transposase
MEVAVVPDILTLRTQLCEVERRADIAEAEAANARAVNADLQARNVLLELQIEKLKRD